MPNTVNPGVNKLLSGMSVLYKNHNFVSDDVWKPMRVTRQTGNYLRFDKSLYDITNTARGVRQEAVSADFGWDNDVYALERHAFSTMVYDDEAEESEEVDLSTYAVQWSKEKILLEQELLAFGAGSPINAAGSNSGSTTLDLSTLTTADFKAPLVTGTKSIELAAGLSPNMLVMNPDVMRNIVATTQFQESIKYVVPTIEIGGLLLPTNLFGLPVKYVQAIANTTNDGQAVSNSRIMPNNIWMGYVAPNPMAKYVLTYGARIWKDDLVTVKRELDPRGNKYINENNYTFKTIAPECGYLITVTLASGF